MPTGVVELLIVGIIILVLFGKRLPGLMRSLGSSVVEFKKGVNETDEFAEEDRARLKATDKEKEEAKTSA
jgi:sec-independent protein translocase protein TatA